MKKKCFIFFMICLCVFNLFAQDKKEIVDLKVKSENLDETESSWLVSAVSDKVKENLSKYTDFLFMSSESLKEVFEIQKRSESFAFDQNDSIEFGKIKNPDYQLLVTVRKNNNNYSLSLKLTDVTTGVDKIPMILSSQKSNVENLYSSRGCAVDELTIKFREDLGNPFTEVEKSFIMNGDIYLSDSDKASIYNSEIELYNKLLNENNEELKIASLSTDADASTEEKRLLAKKLLIEEKIKIAEANKQAAIEEEKRKMEAEAFYESRNEEQKKRLIDLTNALDDKIKELRKDDYDSKSLWGQINVIELKKKAALEIYDSIETEKDLLAQQKKIELDNKYNEIYDKPYLSIELGADGNPNKGAIKKRDSDFSRESKKIKDRYAENERQLSEKLDKQIISLIIEIDKDQNNLKPKKISTLGNELSIMYGKFDGSKLGWDLYVTVKSEDVVLLQTKSFLSFETLTGKNPEKYMENDYDGYIDDVLFYDNMFLRGEPVLTYEVKYSINPMDLKNPSKYNFSFSEFKFHDTKNLKLDESNNLYSSKEKTLTLETYDSVKQITPIYNIEPLESYMAISKKEDFKEKERIAKNEKFEIAKDSLVFLDNGTYGNIGPQGEYVLFGLWPQSVKAEDVVIDTSKTENINGWECYKGDDGGFYVKTTAVKSPEIKFSNNTSCKKGYEYYFLLEPIKWHRATNNCLVAENVLDLSIYYKSENERGFLFSKVFPNQYESSAIRAYLNGLDGRDYNVEDFTGKGFINKAFSKKAIEKIATTEVSNNAKSTAFEEDKLFNVKNTLSPTTKDKIFLLSREELLNPDFGVFDLDSDIDSEFNKKLRQVKLTDYAIAIGGYFGSDNEPNGKWWLRTPYGSKKQRTACEVTQTGKIDDGLVTARLGVVPVLNLKDGFLPPEKISDLDVVLDGHKLSLSWKNPKNFERIVISGLEKNDIKRYGKPGEVMHEDFDLEANKDYDIFIQTEDKDGNKNRGAEIHFKTDAVILDYWKYEVPEKIEDKNSIHDLYLFGLWPKSLKEDDVIIDISKTVKINNMDCYIGNDSNYYVKMQSKRSNSWDSIKYFDNGKKNTPKEYYYFKVEPIKWRAISDDYNNGKLLLAEDIISADYYDEKNKTYRYKYTTSHIRHWLVSEFLRSAFDSESAKILKETEMEGAEDKVFLINSHIYWDLLNDEDREILKQKRPTDYAKAKGYEKSEYISSYWWWGSDLSKEYTFEAWTVNGGCTFTYEEGGGVVPAIVIPKSY